MTGPFGITVTRRLYWRGMLLGALVSNVATVAGGGINALPAIGIGVNWVSLLLLHPLLLLLHPLMDKQSEAIFGRDPLCRRMGWGVGLPVMSLAIVFVGSALLAQLR